MRKEPKTEEGLFTYKYCMEQLSLAQEADHDNREAARNALLFIHKRDGMWEPDESQAGTSKPRYQFDLCSPIIKQITGEIKQANFGIHVDPAGGEASEEVAKTYAGLVRNIEAQSKAQKLAYNPANKNTVSCGIGGWRVIQDYVDSDSFDQDLLIDPIHNFHDRVWFNVGHERQDASDATMCWVMNAYSNDQYDRLWPDRAKAPLSPDVERNAYFNKRDVVIVGEFYYLRGEEKELALFDNGAVHVVDDEFEKVRDELTAMGIEEVRRRKKTVQVCYVRQFDQRGWMDDNPDRTVFTRIPVVPEYANFTVIDNKVIWYGEIEKLMDPQRIINYAISREVEEGALAPREKIVMTPEQAKGHETELASMNNNTDPVQLYNHADGHAPPFKIGGPNINPGLARVTETMSALINQQAGLFAANMGDNPNAQSGVAIGKLQEKGDNGTYDFVESHEIAIARTFDVLVDALPKVYKPNRQARILREDGSSDIITIGETVMDEQTGDEVVLNDLNQGNYSVVCRAGPAYKNLQEKTVAAMIDIARVKPEVLDIGGDLFMQNINAPGAQEIGERLRQQLFEQGLIPESQMTDEEKQIAAMMKQLQEAQGAQMTPDQMIGQSEMIKAQTDQFETQADAMEKAQKIDLEREKFQHTRRNDMFQQLMEVQKFQAEQNSRINDGLGQLSQAMRQIQESLNQVQGQTPAPPRVFNQR